MKNSRRKFLQQSSIAMAGLGLAMPLEAIAAQRKKVGANDKIRFVYRNIIRYPASHSPFAHRFERRHQPGTTGWLLGRRTHQWVTDRFASGRRRRNFQYKTR